MRKHREESNANDLEQNNIMQNHRKESNANPIKFLQGKSDGRVETKDSFKRNKFLQKGMFLSVCIQMEMIHFTVINFFKMLNHKRTIFFFFFFNYKQAGE